MLRSDIGSEKISESPILWSVRPLNRLIYWQILLYCDILFTISASDNFANSAVFKHSNIKYTCCHSSAVFSVYIAFIFFFFNY